MTNALISADDALQRLIDGNERFRRGEIRLGPADLVVEIASDSDPRLDYREKLPRYRAAGIEEILIVDPFQRKVDAETKLADGYTARSLSAGRLDSIVLPGLWIEVAWLWQDALPSTVQCLRAILGIG